MNEKKHRVVIIDGNSLMFRAYYATAYTGNLMKTSYGLYTNALFAFINMMNKIIETTEPTHMLVAFDTDKKTFRHEQYQEYKGKRDKLEEELAIQIPLIKEYLDVCQIKRLEVPRYEADDIVGSASKLAKANGIEAFLISGDKDLLQLVNETTTVFLTKKGISELEEYNIDNYYEKLGFYPNQHVDYKALVGDSSDNLPGIRGVGPKTAVSLIKEYHSLDNIIANTNQMKGKLAENIILDRDVALKTKELAKIYCDMELPLSIDDICMKPINNVELRMFYEKMELKSFINKMSMNTDIKNDDVLDVINYHYNDVIALNKCLNQDAYVEIALDGDNYHNANILGIGLLFGNDGYFFDKSYLYNESLRQYLENPVYAKNVIDSKKMIVALNKLDINIKNITFDFILGSYIINPTYTSGDLRSIFEKYTKVNLPYHEEIYGKKSKYVISDEKLYAKYVIDEIACLKKVMPKMKELLHENNQEKLLYEIELPLADVLARMEIAGFSVSKKRLEEIGFDLAKKLKEFEEQIYISAGIEFNIASPKQLGEVLFERLNLGKGKKNKTGYATSAEVLESLASLHEVPRLVLEYRKNAKLYNTYVTGLIECINPIDQKVHTIFKQALTTTGRLSSIEPNIQNIPIRTEEGRIIRSAFIPSKPNGWLVSADYSQIELRVLSSMANAKAMMDDFNHGMDLHTATAARINGVTYQEVTKDMRRVAKTVNFGIIYGMSDWGLAEALKISPIDASIFIDKYFKVYPEIRSFLDQTIIDAKEVGYSKTLFGRRRYMPDLKSTNNTLRKFAERTAMNAPIQGSAADIIKIAMIKVDKALKDNNLQSKLVAQVHDELIIDTCENELEVVKEILKTTMENAVDIGVKLTSEVEQGKTWDMK